MTEHRRSRRRPALAVLAVAALAPLGACDLLNTPGGEPDEVSVVIESSDASQVSVVTSMDFLTVPNPECPEECPSSIELVRADTADAALPFDRSYRFSSKLQFFVETFHLGDEPVTISMRVTIDDRVWYDDFRTLSPTGDEGERETLRFVYRYREGGVF